MQLFSYGASLERFCLTVRVRQNVCLVGGKIEFYLHAESAVVQSKLDFAAYKKLKESQMNIKLKSNLCCVIEAFCSFFLLSNAKELFLYGDFWWF